MRIVGVLDWLNVLAAEIGVDDLEVWQDEEVHIPEDHAGGDEEIEISHLDAIESWWFRRQVVRMNED